MTLVAIENLGRLVQLAVVINIDLHGVVDGDLVIACALLLRGWQALDDGAYGCAVAVLVVDYAQSAVAEIDVEASVSLVISKAKG